MKKILVDIRFRGHFKETIKLIIIILNLIGFSIGIIVGGQSHIYIESIVVNNERNYEVESFPVLNEIIITANNTNTETVNLTIFTQHTDTGFYEKFELNPGESISSDNEYILAYADSSLLEVTFLTSSGPQGVLISIKGENRRLFAILQDFKVPMQRNPMFTAYFFIAVLIPMLLLSYLTFFINFFYIRTNQLHKTSSGKRLLLETGIPVIYLTSWFILPIPPFVLMPVMIFIFLVSAIGSRIVVQRNQTWSEGFLTTGFTFSVTAILLYFFYAPLEPVIYNNQVIIELLPILPITLSFLISGAIALFVGFRFPLPPRETQETIK